MKKVILAIALLIFCAGLCTFEQVTVKSLYSNADAIINEALDYADRGEFENAKSSCLKLKKYWDKKYPYLSSMTDYSLLDGAKLAVNSLAEVKENDADELKEGLIEAKSEIEIIKDNQSINFGNIF